MSTKILDCTVFLIVIMLVSFSSSFPDLAQQRGPTTDASEARGDDDGYLDELKCISPGDTFDPVNLFTDDEFLDGEAGDSGNIEGEIGVNATRSDIETPAEKVVWRKLIANKYYGVLRDRFYVRNTDGLITMQLRDGEATSAATIMGMEDDWKFEYVLAKANIFYSQSKHYGSQHSIRGETYAFEIQFVHYRKDLKTLEDATTTKHGILVICILFESTGKQNPYMDPLVAAAIMSVFPTDKLHVAHGPLDIKALFPSDMSNLQYTGLHASHPCAREAKYVVVLSPRQISEKQLKKFREIRDDEGSSNPGVFGAFVGESVKKGIVVSVSKNVRLQVVKRAELSVGSMLKASLFFTLCMMKLLLVCFVQLNARLS